MVLDPHYLLTIAELYLNLEEPIPIQKGTKLLETVTQKIPGYASAHLLLAKSKMANGALAMQHVSKVLEINPKS